MKKYRQPIVVYRQGSNGRGVPLRRDRGGWVVDAGASCLSWGEGFSTLLLAT